MAVSSQKGPFEGVGQGALEDELHDEGRLEPGVGGDLPGGGWPCGGGVGGVSEGQYRIRWSKFAVASLDAGRISLNPIFSLESAGRSRLERDRRWVRALPVMEMPMG